MPFESDIQAFADTDHLHPPQPGGILFVGSSIFRLWTNVVDAMKPLPVLNRAFGGSRTGDQLARFDQVVAPYAPKVIVYYCGSNDLKAGDAPEAIFERFKQFSERVHQTLPATRLLFVSSTRSPDRTARWDQVDRYNALVRDYCAASPNRTFIDINPLLFDASGQPRRELYESDQLHLQPAAYAEMAARIKPILAATWEAVSRPAPASQQSKPDR
jgi:lysophospholipase L1-like esterase